MLKALERTSQLVQPGSKLAELIYRKAQLGMLPNQKLLGLSTDEIQAALEGRRSALEATQQHERVIEARALGIEAIVRQVARPSLLVEDGKISLTDTDGFPDDLTSHLQRISDVVSRVGRVEILNHRMDWAGTGWVVEDRIIITNRHVAEFFAGPMGPGRYGFLLNTVSGRTYGSKIDFREEYARPEVVEVKVTGIRYIAGPGEPDIALLQMDESATLPLPLILAAKEVQRDQLIAVVGYPAYDSRNDQQDIAHYFGNIFNKKRFAPGYITQQPASGQDLMHDCTTLGGNSGSVLFDLETGEAIGLHFAGNYLVGNYAVPVRAIKAALAGVRTMISLATTEKVEEKADGSHDAEYFLGRDGYQVSFLGAGFEVPLPDCNAHHNDLIQVSGTNGEKTVEITYRHFSVLYSRSRRVPRLTAVNIDGATHKRIKRQKSGDQWFFDLRISPELQLNKNDYGLSLIDRGHMVRREDPNWGAIEEAQQANDDTFHYTNAAPQHSRLNQNNKTWLGLENYILDNARTFGLQACVFTGPILRENDPLLENTNVQIPLEFWKVVVVRDAERNKLHATGYVLGQGQLVRDITEGFLYDEFGTYQVAITTIAKASGINFKGLEENDPLGKRIREEEAAGGRLIAIPISSERDIYFG
ncbi:DNA/RNA non-specific endonuclease [Nitrosomonas communis]|uniref:Serine protease n=1 Tax=Nitrosomonas communis TaxID=44574 RepID=A0A1I4RE50_9PROT|nr:DNA/RNA non-specific endonuclease [Nitrosomonas communis]SFM50485.1 endonuclease G [Nitrosomonas communis]